MPRRTLKSFVVLIGIAVISLCLLGSRLLTRSHGNRRVHLNARLSAPDRRNRLFNNVPGEPQRNDEWMHEFVLKGDIAHPHHQDLKVMARKLDTVSDSIPNSEDDYHFEQQDANDKANNANVTIHKIILKMPEVVPRNGSQTCSPQKSVAMIKTHKCSSSTLQNILLRKAEDLNLTVAVPRDSVYLGSPDYFDRRYILGDDGHTRYNIMASHMRFRRPGDVRSVMAEDAKYITILRDPAKQYESVYTYYGWNKQYHADMSRFLENPKRLFHIFEPMRPRIAGRNPMSYDNGFDTRRLSPGDSKVDSFIDRLGKWYDLVLIAEYFDESLILLKEIMCWTLDDIVSFSQNARNNESVVPMSPADQVAIRRWNWADTKLYKHFNATLWARINIFGTARMERELEKLRLKKDTLAKDCIGEVVKEGDKRVWYPDGIKVNSFILNQNAVHKHLCEQLTRPELTFLNIFRQKLYGSDRFPGIRRPPRNVAKRNVNLGFKAPN